MGVLSRVPTGVPVDPDAEQARRWAEEELSKAVYDDAPGPVERLLDWLAGLLDSVSGLSATPPALVPLVLVAVLAALLLAARVLGGRVRRKATGPAADGALFEDARSSADLTASADAAARRGDHAAAVLDRFRAIIRSLDERGALQDRPGLTAHEAAALAATALPDLSRPLRWAGRLFDDVRYGHATATAVEDGTLRELAGQVRQARPTTAGTHAWSEVR